MEVAKLLLLMVTSCLIKKVLNWCRNFTEVQTNIHAEEMSKRPPSILKAELRELIREDHHLMVNELS